MVILISGWKGSGKDEAGKAILSAFNAERRAFADPLKDLVASKYQIPREWLDDRDKKEEAILSLPASPRDAFADAVHKIINKELKEVNGVKYWTPRALAILEGSIARSVDPDFWVKTAIRGEENKIYVITDLRYRNEIEFVKQNCNKVLSIRIERFKTPNSEDASERDLDGYQGFDAIVQNDKDLNSLKEAVLFAVRNWL